MKSHRVLGGVATVLLGASAVAGEDVGTAFTYQGFLEDASGPVTGSYDFRFRLYNALTGGSQIGLSQTFDGNFNPEVTVENGLFEVTMDFGPLFDGTAIWLEIDIRPGVGGTYTTLSPRVELTPAPHAVHAEQAIRAVDGVGPPNALEVDPVNSRVGIGTASPAEALDVNGRIRTYGSGGSLTLDGAGRQISAGSDETLRIYNNTTALNSRSWIELWGADTSRAGELASRAPTYLCGAGPRPRVQAPSESAWTPTATSESAHRCRSSNYTFPAAAMRPSPVEDLCSWDPPHRPIWPSTQMRSCHATTAPLPPSR